MNFTMTVVLGASVCLAQTKVAEGAFQLHSPEEGEHIVTRWSITDDGGRYHLVSKLQLHDPNRSVVQDEVLDRSLIPQQVRFALRTGPKVTTVMCSLGDRVACEGKADGQLLRSVPFKPTGAYQLYIDGLLSMDFGWLTQATIQLGDHGIDRTFRANTLNVSDSEDLRSLRVWEDEPTEVQFIGVENLRLQGVDVRCRHYRIGEKEEGAVHIWLTTRGIPLKVTVGGAPLELVQYKQYEPLIPALPVSPR